VKKKNATRQNKSQMRNSSKNHSKSTKIKLRTIKENIFYCFDTLFDVLSLKLNFKNKKFEIDLQSVFMNMIFLLGEKMLNKMSVCSMIFCLFDFCANF
jgi:hypothetical protein